MMRPRGKPPMPRAISSPSEPVEMTSESVAGSRAPSFMIDPLPKARSICPNAASSAFCLSIVSFSTRRNAVFDIANSSFIGQRVLRRKSEDCTSFVPNSASSFYVLF
jgi:hypothetical protein